MRAEKERIIRIIETMPEDKLQAVAEAVDEIEDQDLDLELDSGAPIPEGLVLRNKEEFHRFVQRGLDDIKAGRVHTLEETIAYTNNL